MFHAGQVLRRIADVLYEIPSIQVNCTKVFGYSPSISDNKFKALSIVMWTLLEGVSDKTGLVGKKSSIEKDKVRLTMPINWPNSFRSGYSPLTV